MKDDTGSKLTLNQERYIETIFDLTESHGHAHTKSIAESLNIRMASVTEAIRSLSEKGLVNYQVRKTITLTKSGLLIAKRLHRRHLALAGFFEKILGCETKEANDVACKIEHVINDRLRHRIDKFVEYTENEQNSDYLKFIKNFQNEYNKAIEV